MAEIPWISSPDVPVKKCGVVSPTQPLVLIFAMWVL